MDGFGCFFRVINLEFDLLWLSLVISFVWTASKTRLLTDRNLKNLHRKSLIESKKSLQN